MIDRTTGLPIRVLTAETGPYIPFPYDQIDEVRQVLESRGIRYQLDEDALSMNGGPFIAMIDFERGADANAIQAILDGVH